MFCRIQICQDSRQIFIYSACASARALIEDERRHSHLLTRGLKQKRYLTTKLINMYVNYGSLEDACPVFDELSKQNGML